MVISRAICPRPRGSLGGIEADGAMWCLGTSCAWGAAVGTGPLVTACLRLGRRIPFPAAVIHAGWPLPFLPDQRHRELPSGLRRAQLPLEKAGPAGGPLLSPSLWLTKALISTQASHQAQAIPGAGLVRPMEIRACVCEGHTFSPKLHTEIHLDSIPGLNSFCSFEDAKQKEQQNAKRKITK